MLLFLGTKSKLKKRKEECGMGFDYSESYRKNFNTPLKKLFPIFGIQPLIRTLFPFIKKRDHQHPEHTEDEVRIITTHIKEHNFGSQKTLCDVSGQFLFKGPHPVQAAIIRYMTEWEAEEGHKRIHALVLEAADSVCTGSPAPSVPRSGFLP